MDLAAFAVSCLTPNIGTFAPNADAPDLSLPHAFCHDFGVSTFAYSFGDTRYDAFPKDKPFIARYASSNHPTLVVISIASVMASDDTAATFKSYCLLEPMKESARSFATAVSIDPNLPSIFPSM